MATTAAVVLSWWAVLASLKSIPLRSPLRRRSSPLNVLSGMGAPGDGVARRAYGLGFKGPGGVEADWSFGASDWPAAAVAGFEASDWPAAVVAGRGAGLEHTCPSR